MDARRPTEPLRPDEGVMIAAFEGWNDAGSAASSAVDHLSRVWSASEFGALDSEEYHDFQVNRPSLSRGPSGERIVSWPGTIVSTTPGPWIEDRSIVLTRGIEPSKRWRQFSEEILDIGQDLDVDTLITCGALLVDTPHTRPLPMYVTSEDAESRQRFDLERSDYEGPIGITGVLAHEASLRGMAVITIWVGVPHYVASTPSPKATLALLAGIERMLGEPIDLGDLPYEAEAWQRGADELTAEDDDVADHVRQLEEFVDASNLPEASGDAIAMEFEQFLKRRDPGK